MVLWVVFVKWWRNMCRGARHRHHSHEAGSGARNELNGRRNRRPQSAWRHHELKTWRHCFGVMCLFFSGNAAASFKLISFFLFCFFAAFLLDALIYVFFFCFVLSVHVVISAQLGLLMFSPGTIPTCSFHSSSSFSLLHRRANGGNLAT